MKKKIIVTGIIPKEGVEKLREQFDVTYTEGEFTREYVLEHLHEYDGLLLMGLQADKELIDAGTNLKIIATNSVGYDHIDLEYAKSKGIIVCNSPNGVRAATAEMTMALMLAITKRLGEYDKDIRDGVWYDVSKREHMGLSLFGSTLGIYGIGSIGKAVARLAKAFDMNIIYHEPRRMDEAIEKELGVSYVSFDEMIEQSDVLTLHVPLLESTRHKINADAFKKMKPTSYLINASRGQIVKEDDLVEALKNNEIAGAALDVFENEPTPNKELLSMKNVIMSPHAATGTLAARVQIAEEATSNLVSYLINGVEQNRVNK